MTHNTHLSTKFQAYKGLFFILFTSILLFKIINNHFKYLKNIIIEKDLKLNRINNNVNNLFGLSMKMLTPLEYNDEYFIKEIFRIASSVPKGNDLGSAYIVNNGEIEFIDSIGFHLKELKEMNKDINLYKIPSEKIVVNRTCQKEVEKN